MPKKNTLFVILPLCLLIAACGSKASATPEASASSATPNPCSAENIPAEVANVHNLTREFDDYSALASNTPQAQLVQLIPELQRILRDAEDLQVPACLLTLKEMQLAHMNTVVITLMAFMRTTDPAGLEQINAGIAQARELHGQYDVERARLLGITLTPTLASPPGTPDANATPASSTAPTATVTNLGADGINLRAAPNLNAAETGTLGAQVSTGAFGQTADGQWIQVQIPEEPGQRAWVYASLVQLSVAEDQLPVIVP